MKQNTINCPNCGYEIDVNKVLYHQIQNDVSSDFKKQIAAREKEFSLKESRMKKEIQAIVEKDFSEKFRKHDLEIKKELAKKDLQLKEMNKLKQETELLKRQKADAEKRIEKEMKIKMEKQLAEETAKIREIADAEMERKSKAQEQKIKQLTKLVSEAKRQAEQGSIQLQGEAQELCIEQWLQKMFPDDVILEVKKGVKGADCIHTVMSDGKQCAKIYYESKNTKVFKQEWIEKLKKDMINEKANAGVIITETMPQGAKDVALIDGIFVCSYTASKSLCLIIREFALRAYNVFAAGKDKNNKKEMLYDYLTSDEFMMKIETVFNKLVEMKSQIDKEKDASVKQWKKREENIMAIINTVAGICISVKQITGKNMPKNEELEMLLLD